MESWPFLLLADIVQDFHYIDRKGFRMVKCRRQQAYGCGPNGDAIVRGLALYVRLGAADDPYESPKLCLYYSDEVFDRVGSEIDDRNAELYGRDLRCSCRICTVDGNVMVLCVSFMASFCSADFRSYYLVYDSAAASLSLLPRLPTGCRPVCTESPLVLKVGDEDKCSQLVLMADRSVRTASKYTHPVLCLSSPSPPSPDHNGLNYNSKRVWVLKGRVGVNAFPNSFEANVLFLFKGNAAWGDLAQGILYCDCSHLIDSTDPVPFKHIMLPEECMISSEDLDVLDRCSLGVHRTMGCVGDSIWFVIIEPTFTRPGDTRVKVWTLDLLSKEEKWNLHNDFKMLELFSREQGHPKTVPKFPMFIQQADCGLYMLLPEIYTGGKAYGHLLCIDLRSSCEPFLMSNRRLAIPSMNNPVILDRDFFNPLHLAA
ncbi:unnamed protein product [Alopecurus aequalis]